MFNIYKIQGSKSPYFNIRGVGQKSRWSFKDIFGEYWEYCVYLYMLLGVNGFA